MLLQQHDIAAGGKKPRSGGEKAHGVCRPGRDTAARRKKDLIGLCEVVVCVR